MRNESCRQVDEKAYPAGKEERSFPLCDTPDFLS